MKSDFKTIILPQGVFGIATVLAELSSRTSGGRIL
jgi:hypothetical protein